MRRSFRLRLALWYSGVLSAVLLGFALLVSYGFRTTAGRLVDQELAERVRGFERLPRPRRQPPRPGFRPWQGRRPRSFDDDAERVADIWRPRFAGAAERGQDSLWDPEAAASALRDGRRFSTVTVNGERLRLLTVRWPLGDGQPGVLQVARSLAAFDQLWASQQRLLLALLPLCLLVAAGGGVWLTGRALRPLREVTTAAAEIGAEDLSRRLPVSGDDELAELARTFNGMVGRLEEAFERQRQFTADASHELRTPLTRIKTGTSVALAGPADLEDYRAALEVADRGADSMTRLVEQLLILARADAGQLVHHARPLDLRTVVSDVAERSERVAVTLPGAPAMVRGDGPLLERVIENLVQNALRHSPPESAVAVKLALDDEVVVTVADQGEGIAAEHLSQLTRRFYRVDSARSRRHGGAGLGLAICESIVTASGGSLTIESEEGVGTTVTVRLPRLSEAAARAGAEVGHGEDR